MNKRTFNKILKEVSNKKTGLLDKDKIKLLDNETKTSLVHFIVRNRAAVIVNFIPENFDTAWLHSMGYLYTGSNKHFDFVGTSENIQKIGV